MARCSATAATRGAGPQAKEHLWRLRQGFRDFDQIIMPGDGHQAFSGREEELLGRHLGELLDGLLAAAGDQGTKQKAVIAH
jgi:hypothetical protein